MSQSMWRIARAEDEASIAEMCRSLYVEDPGPLPVPADNIHATLAAFNRDPSRGQAVVLDIDGKVSGYALLIPFWSNELGGDICEVDELFIAPEHRNHGHGTAMFAAIREGTLWPRPIAGFALGVTPDNAAARRLYKRLGFAEVGIAMVHRTAVLRR